MHNISYTVTTQINYMLDFWQTKYQFFLIAFHVMWWLNYLHCMRDQHRKWMHLAYKTKITDIF